MHTSLVAPSMRLPSYPPLCSARAARAPSMPTRVCAMASAWVHCIPLPIHVHTTCLARLTATFPLRRQLVPVCVAACTQAPLVNCSGLLLCWYRGASLLKGVSLTLQSSNGTKKKRISVLSLPILKFLTTLQVIVGTWLIPRSSSLLSVQEYRVLLRFTSSLCHSNSEFLHTL